MSLPVVILTPEKTIKTVEADAVVVPAFGGELGIQQGHAPLLAQLTAGEIRIRQGDRVEHIAVSGGFVEVRANRAVILVETAELAAEIDVEQARQAAERAQEAKRSARTDADLSQAEAALRRALAQLRAAGAVGRPRRSSGRRAPPS